MNLKIRLNAKLAKVIMETPPRRTLWSGSVPNLPRTPLIWLL
jgi:hypothetical protein